MLNELLLLLFFYYYFKKIKRDISEKVIFQLPFFLVYLKKKN